MTAFEIEPDPPPGLRSTLPPRPAPEPSAIGDDAPLAGLRSPRIAYALAALVAVLALVLRFEPSEASSNEAGSSAGLHVISVFQDEAGSFRFTGSPEQREAIAWLVLALGFGGLAIVSGGRRRGVAALFLGAIATTFVLSAPTSMASMFGSPPRDLLCLGGALVAGALVAGALVTDASRSEVASARWRTLAAGFALLVPAFVIGSGHVDAPYRMPLADAFSDLSQIGGEETAAIVARTAPLLLGGLLATLALLGLVGGRGRLAPALASIALWGILIACAAAAVSIGLDEFVRSHLAPFALAIAAAVRETIGRGRS